jgi:hypothetical protein
LRRANFRRLSQRFRVIMDDSRLVVFPDDYDRSMSVRR